MADTPERAYICPACHGPLDPGIDTTCPRCSQPVAPRTLDQPDRTPDLVPFFGDLVTPEFKARRDAIVAEHIAEARQLLHESRPYADRIAIEAAQ